MAELSIETLPPMTRLSVRCPAAPAPPGAHAVLRLGPDEWLVLGAAGSVPGAASVVDVSDGYAAFRVAGAGAADLLNEGCPLDLSDAAFPPGSCTRTLFGKAEIVLWRPGPEAAFHVEVARSFAAYVAALLEQARPA